MNKQTGVKVKIDKNVSNIFGWVGIARRAMIEHGYKKEAEDMFDDVIRSGGYYNGLDVIMSYVDVDWVEQEKKLSEDE